MSLSFAERRKLDLMCDGLWCADCDNPVDPTWGCACERERIAIDKATTVTNWHAGTTGRLEGITEGLRPTQARALARFVDRSTSHGLAMSDRQAGIPATSDTAEWRRASARLDYNTGPREWSPRKPAPPLDVPFRG